MIDFNEKTVREQADKLYALRGELEAVADKVCEKGFDNILFTSAGGSLAALEPFSYMMKKYVQDPGIYGDPSRADGYGKRPGDRPDGGYPDIKIWGYERNRCGG